MRLAGAATEPLTEDGVVGVLSNGSYSVKFRVETTAENDNQRAAAVAALNDWYASRA